MKNRTSAAAAALLAGCSFTGYNIGSGFATGIEAQQFFASWGSPDAWISLAVALAVTAAVFIPVYLTGLRKKAEPDYSVYHYYCGSRIGRILDGYMIFSILLIILTMMSGAGATIRQFFGIPKGIGAGLLGALCLLAALLDLKKLMKALSCAGAVIMAFVLVCTLTIRFGSGISQTMPAETAEIYAASGEIRRVGLIGLSTPVMSGLASAGLLIVSSLPWVASTGSLCESRKEAVWSGALSAVLFYAAQGVVVYLNLISLDRIAGEEVPALAVFQTFVPAAAMPYTFIILLAIFSTVTGRLFLIADRFGGGSRKIRLAVTGVIVVLFAAAGTILPFSLLSNIMFTVNGCLGILLGLTILVRTALSAGKTLRARR